MRAAPRAPLDAAPPAVPESARFSRSKLSEVETLRSRPTPPPILSASARARFLRPLPGVAAGNYRCGALGYDLNRHWDAPHARLHAEVHAAKALVLEIVADPRRRLDFVVDVHAHSAANNGFMCVSRARGDSRDTILETRFSRIR